MKQSCVKHPNLVAAAILAAWTSLAIAASPSSERTKRDMVTWDLINQIGADRAAQLVDEAVNKALMAPFSMDLLNESTLRFSGPITARSADALADALSSGKVRELRVESIGGEVDAGIRMGHLIRSHGVAVVVDGPCVSSCANYLFAAGVRQTISDGAVVVWHGNAFQKDKRERVQCGRKTSSFSGLPFRGGDDERNQSKQAQRLEDEFAQAIGVDHYIARAGQEPRFFGNFTMSVSDMARFGLHSVEAPKDYGTQAYCERASKTHQMTLHCLSITDEMLAYERARRAVGEVCQPDATLRIRTGRTAD